MEVQVIDLCNFKLFYYSPTGDLDVHQCVDGEGDSGRARRGAGAAGADKAREPIVIESDGPLPGGYGSRFAKGGAWSNDPDEFVIEG